MEEVSLDNRVTEPTGLEPYTPVSIKDTSATERGGFRRCRRQWLLTQVHHLDHQEGKTAFFLGRIYHSGLEAYYRAQMAGDGHAARTEKALSAYQDAYTAEKETLKSQLGIAWQYGWPEFEAAGNLGFTMLQGYCDREATHPLFDEVIAVEFRVNVPIRAPSGRRVGALSVQTDVVGRKDGELIVVDHKTASRKAPSAHLDIDDQLTAEVYSWWKHSGEYPERAVYNVSYKKAPEEPRLLKNGTLSRVTAASTYTTYMAAIEANGLSPADYADVLQALSTREGDDEPFFHREATIRTPGQMKAFEQDLYEEFRDMKAVALHPERAYPNPTSMNCGSCPVRLICVAMQNDEDVADVIKREYVLAPPRR